jgi:hypothetical protein
MDCPGLVFPNFVSTKVLLLLLLLLLLSLLLGRDAMQWYLTCRPTARSCSACYPDRYCFLLLSSSSTLLVPRTQPNVSLEVHLSLLMGCTS